MIISKCGKLKNTSKENFIARKAFSTSANEKSFSGAEF